MFNKLAVGESNSDREREKHRRPPSSLCSLSTQADGQVNRDRPEGERRGWEKERDFHYKQTDLRCERGDGESETERGTIEGIGARSDDRTRIY